MRNKKKTFLMSLRYIYLIFVIGFGLITIIASGGGDGVEVIKYAMRIYNISPDPIIVHSSQGDYSAEVSVDFADANAGVSSMEIRIVDPNDMWSNYEIKYIQIISIPIEGLSGMTSGTIHSKFSINASIKPGTYDARFIVKDINGSESNVDFADLIVE